MTTEDFKSRFARGEVLVANLLNRKGDEYALKVGDKYSFNLTGYTVIEVGTEDLEGLIWIAMDV